ncbi:MAG TPA: RcnB family protein [Caulobacteraceae bacterium]|jgi:Ni/Co efflux regulator RcnB|nr:RcnB family protein [Caulobacteraceae bacterium]
MKTFVLAIAAATLVAGAAGAQGHGGWGRDQGAGHHWSKGERMGPNDWQHATPVDYRAHHLRPPPRGYEWRQSNGQYVLAAIASGAIASIILANH